MNYNNNNNKNKENRQTNQTEQPFKQADALLLRLLVFNSAHHNYGPLFTSDGTLTRYFHGVFFPPLLFLAVSNLLMPSDCAVVDANTMALGGIPTDLHMAGCLLW